MPIPELLLLVAAKVAALLLLTLALALSLRYASAATRHLVWTAGLVAALTVPVVSLLAPALPLLPWPGADVPATPAPVHPAAVVQSVGAGVAFDPALTGARTSTAAVGPAEFAGDPANGPSGAAAPPAAAPGFVPGFAGGARDWWQLLGLFWLAGVATVLLRMAVGRIGLAGLARRAIPVASPEWLETIEAVLVGQRSTRVLRFLESAEVTTPCTWGTIRPVVLLPAEGADWSPEQRRQVVIHEMAHVQRLDALTHFVARLACAIHWFNPLVWLAARSARIAREQACDDLVLADGGAPSGYAELLLFAAAPAGSQWAQAEALAMARRSQLGDRLLAVLDPVRRRGAVRQRTVAWTVAAMLAVALPLGALAPQQPTAPRPPRPPRAAAAPAIPDVVVETPSAPASMAAPEAPRPAPAPPPVAAAAALPAPFAPPDLCFTDPRGGNRTVRLGRGSSFSGHGSFSDDDGNLTAVWTGRDCSVTIRIRGTVTFTPAEDDVASLSRGGRFDIVHEDSRSDRTYVVVNRDGTLERRYAVDGDAATLDAEAREWRAALVLAFIRRSGHDAEARIARIRRGGGMDALLAEIAQIPAGGARARYLTIALADRSLAPRDAARLLDRAAEITSDGDLSDILARVSPALLGDETVQAAFARAAGTIDSDGDLSSVLVKVLETRALDASACEWLLGLTGTIASDGDRSQVLMTASGSLRVDSRCLTRAIALAGAIRSDGDKSSTLARFLDDHGLTAAVREPFFASAVTIGSDGDLASLLHKVLALPAVDEAAVLAVLESTRTIRSAGDCSGVLIAAARRGLVRSGPVRDAYLAATRTIASSGDREAARRAAGMADER